MEKEKRGRSMSPLFGVLRKETEYFSLRGEETSEPET